MKKELIAGTSSEAVTKIEKNLSNYGKLKHVTVYFNNYNFVLSKYEMMSTLVHMVLECEEVELQIESANCGYVGGGPGASVSILTLFGLDKDETERLIQTNAALEFSVIDKQIVYVCTEEIFEGNRTVEPKWVTANKFSYDKNISVDLMTRKIRFFNPQRHNISVFFRLLNGMTNKKMEYYIGEESPLEKSLYIDKKIRKSLWTGDDSIDIEGVEHVNLIISSDECKVVCLIDRKEEIETINMIYWMVTGNTLLEDLYIPQKLSLKEILKIIYRKIKRGKAEIHDVVLIPDVNRKQ